jgi:hypothetical protein
VRGGIYSQRTKGPTRPFGFWPTLDDKIVQDNLCEIGRQSQLATRCSGGDFEIYLPARCDTRHISTRLSSISSMPACLS